MKTMEKDDEHLIRHIDKFKFTKSKSKIMKYAKSFCVKKKNAQSTLLFENQKSGLIKCAHRDKNIKQGNYT